MAGNNPIITQQNMDNYGVSWFTFDEASGNALDSVGNAIGTVYGATRVIGWNGNGKALNLNGSNNYVSLDSSITLDKISIRFKIKTSQASYGLIMSTKNTGVGKGINIGVSNDGKITCAIANGSTSKQINSLKTVNDNLWHDILITKDAKNIFKIYIDNMNTPDFEDTISFGTTGVSHRNVLLGCVLDVAGTSRTYFLNYQLDNLEIYNEVINPFANKILIVNQGNGYSYETMNWINKGSIPAAKTERENFYAQHGMNNITKEQLKQLSSVVPSGKITVAKV